MTVPPRDAYRVTVREAAPSQWEWEILRDGRPLELRLREGLFNSERAAMKIFGKAVAGNPMPNDNQEYCNCANAVKLFYVVHGLGYKFSVMIVSI